MGGTRSNAGTGAGGGGAGAGVRAAPPSGVPSGVIESPALDGGSVYRFSEEPEIRLEASNHNGVIQTLAVRPTNASASAGMVRTDTVLSPEGRRQFDQTLASDLNRRAEGSILRYVSVSRDIDSVVNQYLPGVSNLTPGLGLGQSTLHFVKERGQWRSIGGDEYTNRVRARQEQRG